MYIYLHTHTCMHKHTHKQTHVQTEVIAAIWCLWEPCTMGDDLQCFSTSHPSCVHAYACIGACTYGCKRTRAHQERERARERDREQRERERERDRHSEPKRERETKRLTGVGSRVGACHHRHSSVSTLASHIF